MLIWYLVGICSEDDEIVGTFSSSVGQSSCAEWKICSPGDFVTRLPTATSDRACNVCPAGKISQSENADSCSTCEAGKYQPTIKGDECLFPVDCVAGTHIVQDVTASSNRECGLCLTANNQYQDDRNQLSCKPTTTCQAGEFVSEQPSSVSNRECSSCTLGVSYSDSLNAVACKPVSGCSAGYFQVAAPSLSTNRVCEVLRFLMHF